MGCRASLGTVTAARRAVAADGAAAEDEPAVPAGTAVVAAVPAIVCSAGSAMAVEEPGTGAQLPGTADETQSASTAVADQDRRAAENSR
jgi:hypothetical protein